MNPGARCGADRLCLEGSESRNRLSDTLAWPVFVSRPVRRWRMKYTKLTFLPALPLGFSACAEHPEVVAPNQLRSAFTVSPSVAVIYSNFGPGIAFYADPFYGWTMNGFLGQMPCPIRNCCR